MGTAHNSNAWTGIDAMNRSGRVPATRRDGLAHAVANQHH
jgi:hypothetical protein